MAADFQKEWKKVTKELQNIIDLLDVNLTCKQVYSTIAAGTVVTALASLVPGASGVVSFGSKVYILCFLKKY